MHAQSKRHVALGGSILCGGYRNALYDYLLREDADDKDFLASFNHESLQVLHSKGEASLATTVPGDHFQFLRQGYFVTDKDSTSDHIVVNRIVGLRDSWAKQQKK